MAKKTEGGGGAMSYVCRTMIIVNAVLFGWNLLYLTSKSGGKGGLSWSLRAAEEAEAVADIPCSGHGRAFLDGLVCECNSCYEGFDCSIFSSHCVADAESGDPLFLEPFWMEHAASSGLLMSGWHRMSYIYSDGSYVSKLLEMQIRKLHHFVGNAITDGKYIVFGVGSTQLFNAAIYAFSSNSSSQPPAKVVVTAPYFSLYGSQTELFNSKDYRFEGDTSLWQNKLDNTTRFIEFVTSPNNPDGMLNKAILHGPNVKTIYDHAYFWPHFTAIPAPADEDLMLFTLSKLSGHAGARFGWAVIKDEDVYQKMSKYMSLSTMGISHDTQLRALKIISTIFEGEGGDIFEFAYKTMRDRWIRLSDTLSTSKRFSLQQIAPQYCFFFQRVQEPSPAYAWLKCEREEDKGCDAILRAANISGRGGNKFGSEDCYVRLSLIKSQDDFEILIHHFKNLIAQEQAPKIF